MRQLLFLGFSATLILPACGVSEEQKADQLTEAWCSRYKECRTDGFNKSWDSPGQCQNQESERWLNKLNSIDGETVLSCTFDEKQIKSCADALSAMDCDQFSNKDWEADCDAVLVCSQGLTGDW